MLFEEENNSEGESNAVYLNIKLDYVVEAQD